MRSLRHWTPRYVFDRSRNIASNLAHPDWPWFAPQAVRFLGRWLNSTDIVFEWGAGRSTLWTAQRVRQITSVETDAAWFDKVRLIAQFKHIDNIDLRLISRNLEHQNICHYVDSIAVGDRTFDLIIVDGSMKRDLCALAALPRLKSTGLLLLDNANWYLPSNSRSPFSRSEKEGPASQAWAEFMRQVSAYRSIWMSNGVIDTAIWIKPG